MHKVAIIKKIMFVFFGAGGLFIENVFGQCSLCTKTAAQLGPKAAVGLNTGILYMMAVVLIILGFVIYRLKINKTI